MNKCLFMGNLTSDFELRYSASNVAIARSSLALNRGKDKDGNDKGADFVNLVAFNDTAERMGKFGQKGRRFLFETHVQTGSYEKDGQKHYTTDFIIDRWEFADSKNEGSGTAPASSYGFMNIPEGLEEELPFN